MTTIQQNPVTETFTNVPSSGVWRASVMLAFVVLLVFGLAYSLVATGLGRVLFPDQATGSLVVRGGKIVGSTLVAQPFSSDGYFQPRPSAAKYDPMAAAGSNQARTNPEMRLRVEEARAAVAKREGVTPDHVPSDLVTQSGSGLDPHISLEAASIQVQRVARVRGLPPQLVEDLVHRHTERSLLRFNAPPIVNVLQLNLALNGLRPSTIAK